MDRARRNALIESLSPALQEAGYECVEVQWDSRDATFRIFIDRCDGVPVSVDDCATVDRLLDEKNLLTDQIDSEFYLEVSSPGLDRPLRTTDHFRRYLGSEVSVKLNQSMEDRKSGRGKLLGVSEQGVLEIETKRGLWRCPVDYIDDAHLKYGDMH